MATDWIIPADFKLSLSSLFVVISYCFYLFISFQSVSRCLNFTVIFLTVTSEDMLLHTKRKVFKILFFCMQHACIVSSCHYRSLYSIFIDWEVVTNSYCYKMKLNNVFSLKCLLQSPSSENPPNTDTRIIRTLWHVPLVSVLTGFLCTWKLLSPGFWPLATHQFLN